MTERYARRNLDRGYRLAEQALVEHVVNRLSLGQMLPGEVLRLEATPTPAAGVGAEVAESPTRSVAGAPSQLGRRELLPRDTGGGHAQLGDPPHLGRQRLVRGQGLNGLSA